MTQSGSWNHQNSQSKKSLPDCLMIAENIRGIQQEGSAWVMGEFLCIRMSLNRCVHVLSVVCLFLTRSGPPLILNSILPTRLYFWEIRFFVKLDNWFFDFSRSEAFCFDQSFIAGYQASSLFPLDNRKRSRSTDAPEYRRPWQAHRNVDG